MMKATQAVGLLLLLLAISAGVKAGTTEGFKKQVRPIVNECKAATGATEDDVESAVNLDVNYSENGKCMLKCVLEKLNIMKNNEFITYEQHEDVYKSLFAGDPWRLAHAQEIVNPCHTYAKKHLPGQPCEAAYVSIVCVGTKEKK